MTAARIALAAGVALLLRAVSVPDEPHLRLCGFLWLTGKPCMFCGLTRALFALGKGQWQQALQFHPLSPLALAMIASLWASHPLRGRLWTAGAALFAIFGVLRLAVGI